MASAFHLRCSLRLRSHQISMISSSLLRHNPCKKFQTSLQCQSFSTTPAVFNLPHNRQRLRNRLGPLTLKAGVVFACVAASLWMYFQSEKAKVERKKIANSTKGIGKPKVGGPFQLLDQDGRPFTQEDLKDKYALLYFGYTHCPDICPDELDKMTEMIEMIKHSVGDILMPVLISCDPARDPPAVMKEYLKDFHPDIIGLTGNYESIKQTCKAYRVYFSTPPDVRPDQDYIVDHSIYFFLMDPEGDFVEVIGRNHDAKSGAKIVIDHVKDWDGFLDGSPRRRQMIESKKPE